MVMYSTTKVTLRTSTLTRHMYCPNPSAPGAAEGSSDGVSAASPSLRRNAFLIMSARRTDARSPGVSTHSTGAVVPPLPPVGHRALEPPEPRQEALRERDPVAVDDVEALLAASAQVKHDGWQHAYQRRLRSETHRRRHGEQARGVSTIIRLVVITSHPHGSSSGCTESGSPSDKSAYRTRWAAASAS
jgi:hypothetical protein